MQENKGKLNNKKQFGDFLYSLTAGLLSGLVVGWFFLIYTKLENSGFLLKLIAPLISSLVLLLFIVWFFKEYVFKIKK